MSFLAPWLLAAGLGAVTLPILFHLFRRTPRGKLPFSTLMFLSPSPPQVTRRSRLENWPLLLMRAGVLVLLALAFGRPLWRQLLESQTHPSAGARTVVLLDTSASMRRGDAWNRAVAEVVRAADAASPNDELALMTFDAAVRTHLDFAAWRAAPPSERTPLVRAALAGLTPGWSGTHLDRGLIEAAELLEASDDTRREPGAGREAKRIVLVGDMQTGSRIAGLEGYEWPKQVEVEVVATDVRTTNAGLHALAPVGDAEQADGVRPRVLLVNSADSARESFRLTWKTNEPGIGSAVLPAPAEAPPAGSRGTASSRPAQTPPKPSPSPTASATATASPPPSAAEPPAVEAYVPPGKSRIVRAPPIPPGDFAELVLAGDDEPFDNGLWYVPTAREHVRVLHLAREPRDDPQTLRYFLERAFDDDGAARRVTVETVDPSAAGVRVPQAGDLDDVGLIVLAVDAPLPEAWAAALGNWIDEGGIVAAVLRPNDAGAWRKLLPSSSAEPPKIEVVESDANVEFALLSDIDLRHPLFTPLNDPRFSDFTKIRFWRYRKITLDAASAAGLNVLARFDGASPAIVEATRGRGRMFLLASGWQPRESQLGVSSKFIPLLFTMIDLGRRRPLPVPQFEVGRPIALPNVAAREEPAEDAWTVRTPAGRETTLPAGAAEYVPQEGPGVYELGRGEFVRQVAVNVPVDESRTAPAGPEVLEAVGVVLAKAKAEPTPELLAERRTLQQAEIEARQQLWRPLLAAAFGLAIIETWFAGRSTGGRRDETPSAAEPTTTE